MKRLKMWMYDHYLIHWCSRCDRTLKPWNKCPHNSSFRKRYF